MTRTRALITGAAAGLGQEFARQLAADGKDLILVARRTGPMQALAEELMNTHKIDVDVIQADLSDPAAPATLYATVRKRGLEVDCLTHRGDVRARFRSRPQRGVCCR